MSSLTVQITSQQAAFLERAVGEGRFLDANEAVRAALRLLQSEEEINRLKIAHVRALLTDSDDAVARGEYDKISDTHTIDQFMASICDPLRPGT